MTHPMKPGGNRKISSEVFDSRLSWKYSPGPSRLRPILLVLGLAGVAALLCPRVEAAPAADKPSQVTSANAIAWAQQNLPAYKKYIGYAKSAPAPQVPVPPMVDPPCRPCDSAGKQTEGEAKVAGWVKESREPEATYVSALLEMGRRLELVRVSNTSLLTPAAQAALSQFSESEIKDAEQRLAGRLLRRKAIPMARQYNHEPKQAYAGIMFLLQVGRDAALLQGSDNAELDQMTQLAATWERTITDKIDNDVLSGHKYNLCPVYAEVYRMVELLTKGDARLDMDRFKSTLEKMQKLMKFNVNLTLHVTVKDKSGLDATWTGKAKLKLTLDFGKGCYTPEFENDGQMAMKVENFNLTDKDTKVELTSPHSFNAHLDKPQLNLCDPQPIFQLPLAAHSFPGEELTENGHSTGTFLLGPFLSSVAGVQEVDSAKTNELTGNHPKSSGPDPLAPLSGNSPAFNAAKAKIDAHKGDPSWMMSPAGQAAIAQIKEEALTMAQAMAAKNGYKVPNLSSLEKMITASSSANLNWTNGLAQPVNQTLRAHKDKTDLELTVTVDQASGSAN